MIRDEFKEQQKSLSPKEMKEIRLMGERVYYSSYIQKNTAVIKGLGFSTFTTFILGILVTIFVIYRCLSEDNFLFSTGFYLLSSFALAILLWSAVWYLIIVPSLNKKIAIYRERIKKLNESIIEKQRLAQKQLNKK